MHLSALSAHICPEVNTRRVPETVSIHDNPQTELVPARVSSQSCVSRISTGRPYRTPESYGGTSAFKFVSYDDAEGSDRNLGGAKITADVRLVKEGSGLASACRP
jgi:hypothetical protein